MKSQTTKPEIKQGMTNSEFELAVQKNPIKKYSIKRSKNDSIDVIVTFEDGTVISKCYDKNFFFYLVAIEE